MKILLTGGTGYIGAAVLEGLLAHGHHVTTLVRSADKAKTPAAKGAEIVLGDLTDDELVFRLATANDGVIHLASPGDATSADLDELVVAQILRGLADTNKPFVYTGGLWDHGSGSITELTPKHAPRLTAWRNSIADHVRNATGVRASVIAPGLVYGHSGGLLNLVASGPRSAGNAPALTMIGNGEQHWSSVHVDDLAELYVLALQSATAGSYYIGVNGQTPTVREISEAVSRSMGLDGRVQSEALVQTLERLGLLGEALLLDQRASGEAARRVLGWEPQHHSILAEIAKSPFTWSS